MTAPSLVLGRRMMQAQSLHLFRLALVHRRVIPNQIPCHNGWLGTASPLYLPLTLALLFCYDYRLHGFPKGPQPLLCYRCCFPGGFRQKAAQPCQARSVSNLMQQSSQGSCSFTEHQPQQYGHEVLVLGLREKSAVPFAKVAQVLVQTYNGNWH